MKENAVVSRNQENQVEVARQIRVCAPQVDIFENEHEIRLCADIPGVNREDLNVHIDDGKLTVSGIRTTKTSGAASWEEFGDVEFRRVFSVPQTIDIEGVVAELKDGVLNLHLPKSEAAKPRIVEVKGA